jgi:hypothetical protein
MHNKLQYTWCGDYYMCASCPTPHLNLRFELCPSWINICDAFPTSTMPHTTQAPSHAGDLNFVELISIHTKNMYQFTCTEHKAPDNREVHRLLQNCVSSVLNLPHITHRAPTIWRWLLDFWKICEPPTVCWLSLREQSQWNIKQKLQREWGTHE